ncbi:MAG TPA: sugar transferase [Pirellulales bacterium]
MTPVKTLAKRHHAAVRAPADGQFGLEPVRWFHHSLWRERARADRGGRELALVVFTPRQRRQADKTNARLARLLRRRKNALEEAGWFDGERIALILPEASSDAAWRVADEICLGFPANLPPPLCEVFTYPGDWVSENEVPSHRDSGDGPRQARRMSDLFVQPMPLWKRLMDVLGAGLGLLLLAPLLLPLAALIKLESSGPVFFTQRRTGRGGRPFVMYKFRSMRADAERCKVDLLALNEQDGPAFKIKADPRVTRLGRWLRTTSIDELPQLWHVFKGEMSLVGPRPMDCAEALGYQRWHWRRLDVTPGLTGIWQVRGRSRVSFDEWMRMDLEYVDSISLALDLKLLLATVWVVARGVGAY